MATVSQRPFIKPSKRVIKNLFDFPDPNETKKLVDDMIETESTRLLSLWNFDASTAFSAGSNDENSGKNVARSSIPSNPRFIWQKQERHSTPHYYSKPYIQRSKCKNNMHSHLSGVTSFSSEVAKKDKNLAPLALRDANILESTRSKRSSIKQAISFTSPPKLSSEVVPPTLARFVSALRVPFPSENASDCVRPQSPSVSSCPIKRTEVKTMVASRQLFNERANLKRSFSSVSSYQPKITDLVPLRKTRSLTQKCRRLDIFDQLAPATH